MKIYCHDEIIKFLGEKSSILFSQHFDFVNKIKEIVKIKEKKKGNENIMFCSPNWVYTRNKCPWLMAYGFAQGLIQKTKYHEIL
jgi:hypothetical protein